MLLELCSGTKSVSKVAEKYMKTLTVDICTKHQPDILVDILQWDYKVYPPKTFKMIFASPPCTKYSIASFKRNPEESNDVSRKVMEIIDYFQPEFWVIENPHSSLLWKQDFMQGLNKVKVSYCMYGFPYRTNTFIATNIPFKGKVCDKKCGTIINGYH